MRIKRKLDMDRYETMLRDLEVMRKNSEISNETYSEMKRKYEEKLKELEESYFETEDEITLEFNELGNIIEERVEDAVSRAMDTIKKMSVKIPSWDTACCDLDNRPMKEDIHEGSFDSDNVVINFATENGQIELKKWEKDTYKVIITMKAFRTHGEEDEDESDFHFEHKKGEKEELIFTADEARGTVDIKAYLPDKPKGGVFSSLRGNHMVYTLDLESINGRISVTGLTLKDSDIQTDNGRIGIETVDAETLHVSTENGRILMETVSGDELSLSTENGSIDLMNVQSRDLSASTENGSIRANLSCENADVDTENGSIQITPRSKGTYDVRTEMGSIKIDLDRSIPYSVETRVEMGIIKVASDLKISHYGSHTTTIQSDEFSPEEGVAIKAETQMGKIKIR